MFQSQPSQVCRGGASWCESGRPGADSSCPANGCAGCAGAAGCLAQQVMSMCRGVHIPVVAHADISVSASTQWSLLYICWQSDNTH